MSKTGMKKLGFFVSDLLNIGKYNLNQLKKEDMERFNRLTDNIYHWAVDNFAYIMIIAHFIVIYLYLMKTK